MALHKHRPSTLCITLYRAEAPAAGRAGAQLRDVPTVRNPAYGRVDPVNLTHIQQAATEDERTHDLHHFGPRETEGGTGQPHYSNVLGVAAEMDNSEDAYETVASQSLNYDYI